MKITSIETIRVGWYPRPVWVQVHTDEGLVGLGETTVSPAAAEAVIHHDLAEYLMGKDPLDVTSHHAEMMRRLRTWRTRDAATQAISAVDIALWDIAGQAKGEPIHRMLGGKARDQIRIYNTCASPAYAVRQGTSTTEISRPGTGSGNEPIQDDLQAFLTDAGTLAESLLAEGITAMKIWPFDQFAPESNGQMITNVQLEAAVEPFRKIREAVGNRMEIAAELHSLWSVPAAIRIAKALEPFTPIWIEDAVHPSNVDALAQVTAVTNIPVAASELLATREAYRDLFDHGGVRVCMLDVTWVGGLTEARAVASMAQAAKLPVTPHDCTGPVNLMAGLHLSIHAPNTMVQETVRSFNSEVYPRIVDRMPRIENGFAFAPDEPGLGMALKPEFLGAEDTVIQRTA
ncbi:MAG: mandelate racemase/muconate lactonizing enzyme family protein [Dehalococcoidia bacterium]